MMIMNDKMIKINFSHGQEQFYNQYFTVNKIHKPTYKNVWREM